MTSRFPHDISITVKAKFTVMYMIFVKSEKIQRAGPVGPGIEFATLRFGDVPRLDS